MAKKLLKRALGMAEDPTYGGFAIVIEFDRERRGNRYVVSRAFFENGVIDQTSKVPRGTYYSYDEAKLYAKNETILGFPGIPPIVFVNGDHYFVKAPSQAKMEAKKEANG